MTTEEEQNEEILRLRGRVHDLRNELARIGLLELQVKAMRAQVRLAVAIVLAVGSAGAGLVRWSLDHIIHDAIAAHDARRRAP